MTDYLGLTDHERRDSLPGPGTYLVNSPYDLPSDIVYDSYSYVFWSAIFPNPLDVLYRAIRSSKKRRSNQISFTITDHGTIEFSDYLSALVFEQLGYEFIKSGYNRGFYAEAQIPFSGDPPLENEELLPCSEISKQIAEGTHSPNVRVVAGREGKVDLGLFTEQGGKKVDHKINFFKSFNRDTWFWYTGLTVGNTHIDSRLTGISTKWKASAHQIKNYGSVSGNTFSGRLAGTTTQGFLFYDNLVSIYESIFGYHPLIPRIRWDTSFTLNYDTGQGNIQMNHGLYPSFEVLVNDRLVYYDKQFLGHSDNQIIRSAGLAGLFGVEIKEANFQLCDPDE